MHDGMTVRSTPSILSDCIFASAKVNLGPRDIETTSGNLEYDSKRLKLELIHARNMSSTDTD